MKILLSAFACAPGRGAEPGVGWGILREISKLHDTWVLTHSNNRDAIGCALAESPMPRARFFFLPSSPLSSRWREKPGIHQLDYVLWQWRAYSFVRCLHKEIGFDIVHHATLVNSWMPSFLGLLGPPFLRNAGGNAGVPFRFLSSLSLRGRLAEFVRSVSLPVLSAISHASFSAAKHSAAVLITSPPRLRKKNLPFVEFPLGGLSRSEFEFLRSLPARRNTPFRIFSIGHLLPSKGFQLGLHAFAEFHRRYPQSEFWIIGEGIERGHLRKLAARKGLAGAVQFLDWIPRRKLLALLADADVLLHPSFHENFGHVLLEAMAAGRPVICLDTSAPACLVPAIAGIKIPVTTPERVIASLIDSLHLLATDPHRRFAIGRAAQRHVEAHWLWEPVGQRLEALYLAAAPGTLPEPHLLVRAADQRS